MGTLTYLKSFLKDKNVASVTPSSRKCVKHVVRKMELDRPVVVVEYGPGTGVFTRYILSRMQHDARLIAFETNPNFVEKLRKIDDLRLEVRHDSVEHVKELIGGQFLGKVDYIVSGIPFSFLDEEQTGDLLAQSRELLRSGGKFLAYQTSKHLKEPLREAFGNVKTEFELFNIPPMVIYEAEKRDD